MNFIQKAVGKIALKALSYSGTLSLTEHDKEIIFHQLGGFMPLNWENNSNIQVREGYSQNVDVYAIIKKIVDISKSTPWVVERKQYNGNWKVLENTTIHELMDAPNITKGYTWNDIEEMVLLYLLITGNTYMVGNTQFNSTLIEEIDILPSQAINIYNRNLNFFSPQLQYQFNFGGTSRVYSQDELKHIKFYNPNLQNFDYGLSPIQVAGNVVQVGNERWIADASILGNKGVSGLVSDGSDNPMTTDEAKIAGDELRKKMGGAHKFGRVMVTNKKLTYIPIGLSPADMQLLEKGVVTTRTLCNVLGLDSSLFNDPANKTYNNRLEAEKAMYTNCIIPLSDKISEAFTSWICANHFPMQEVRMRQDFSSVECLQGNKKEESEIDKIKAQTVRNQFKSGFITYNKGLEYLGQPRVDGMDMYYWQMDDAMRVKFDFSEPKTNIDEQN